MHEPYRVENPETLTAKQIEAYVRDQMDEDKEGIRQHEILTSFLELHDGEAIGLRFIKALGDYPGLAELNARVGNQYGMSHVVTTDAKGRQREFLIAYFDSNSKTLPVFQLDPYLHHSEVGFNSCFTVGAVQRNEKRERVLQGDDCKVLAKLVRDAAKAVHALEAWEEDNMYKFPDLTPFTVDKL